MHVNRENQSYRQPTHQKYELFTFCYDYGSIPSGSGISIGANTFCLFANTASLLCQAAETYEVFEVSNFRTTSSSPPTSPVLSLTWAECYGDRIVSKRFKQMKNDIYIYIYKYPNKNVTYK